LLVHRGRAIGVLLQAGTEELRNRLEGFRLGRRHVFNLEER
jgi:hypothetical protein